jgi:hypothetical protein
MPDTDFEDGTWPSRPTPARLWDLRWYEPDREWHIVEPDGCIMEVTDDVNLGMQIIVDNNKGHPFTITKNP